MKKTIPLYWDPQDGTERILIGSSEVDTETHEVVSTITKEGTGLTRRLELPFLVAVLTAPTKFHAKLEDMMPPHTVLSEDAKITFRDEKL